MDLCLRGVTWLAVVGTRTVISSDMLTRSSAAMVAESWASLCSSVLQSFKVSVTGALSVLPHPLARARKLPGGVKIDEELVEVI